MTPSRASASSTSLSDAGPAFEYSSHAEITSALLCPKGGHWHRCASHGPLSHCSIPPDVLVVETRVTSCMLAVKPAESNVNRACVHPSSGHLTVESGAGYLSIALQGPWARFPMDTDPHPVALHRRPDG